MSDAVEESDRQAHDRRHNEAATLARDIAEATIERDRRHDEKQLIPGHNVDDLIVAQTEAVGKLADGIMRFAEQYNVAEESRKKDRRVYLVLIGCIILIAIIVGAGVIRLNHLQTITTDNSTINRQNGEVVRDCVQPDGACYKANQKRTVDTIKQIVDTDKNGIIDHQEILRAIEKRNASGQ